MLGDLELLGAFRFRAAGQARPRRPDALHHREPRVVSGREGGERRPLRPELALHERDRKSTRLNSSHSQISYAVFCLKKKKQQYDTSTLLTQDRRTYRTAY